MATVCHFDCLRHSWRNDALQQSVTLQLYHTMQSKYLLLTEDGESSVLRGQDIDPLCISGSKVASRRTHQSLCGHVHEADDSRLALLIEHWCLSNNQDIAVTFPLSKVNRAGLASRTSVSATRSKTSARGSKTQCMQRTYRGPHKSAVLAALTSWDDPFCKNCAAKVWWGCHVDQAPPTRLEPSAQQASWKLLLWSSSRRKINMAALQGT